MVGRLQSDLSLCEGMESKQLPLCAPVGNPIPPLLPQAGAVEAVLACPVAWPCAPVQPGARGAAGQKCRERPN